MDRLCELPTDAQRRKALDELPKGLNESYERVLVRIKDSAVHLVQHTLYWIVYASPRLRIVKLLEVLSLDEKNRLDPEAVPGEDEVLRCCSSLVRKSGDYLELAHSSVQEYLSSISQDDDRLASFRLDPELRQPWQNLPQIFLLTGNLRESAKRLARAHGNGPKASIL
jgi:hypothetical protein